MIRLGFWRRRCWYTVRPVEVPTFGVRRVEKKDDGTTMLVLSDKSKDKYLVNEGRVHGQARRGPVITSFWRQEVRYFLIQASPGLL